MKNGVVKGALIDTYVAADQKDRLFDETIGVQKILDMKIGYGVVLSGEAAVLQKRCNDFVAQNVEEITDIITANTKTVKVWKYRIPWKSVRNSLEILYPTHLEKTNKLQRISKELISKNFQRISNN